MIRWMALKVQVPREFVPANATFMKLVRDILIPLTSTFENQRNLDPVACDGVYSFQKNLNNFFTGFKITPSVDPMLFLAPPRILEYFFLKKSKI